MEKARAPFQARDALFRDFHGIRIPVFLFRIGDVDAFDGARRNGDGDSAVAAVDVAFHQFGTEADLAASHDGLVGTKGKMPIFSLGPIRPPCE